MILTQNINRSRRIAGPGIAVKRAADVIMSAAALIISPLLLIPAAIAIKISSPGPVFFRQKRTGLMGKEFVCIKLRTMRPNDACDILQATDSDPRITRVGAWLRRTSIDEIPQFWNVLRGDMSVVGPRPHMLTHTRQYSPLIDNYMDRHLVRPGITGLAQVNGFRGPTAELKLMQQRVECDLRYIENWSPMLDLSIIGRTILICLGFVK